MIDDILVTAAGKQKINDQSIYIKMNVCLSVCMYVCMFAIQIHMLAPKLTKLATVKLWAQRQVFNALGVPQVHVLGHSG